MGRSGTIGADAGRPGIGGGMPLRGYGVLRGVARARVTEAGEIPHYQIRLTAWDTEFRAAVNVQSQMSAPDLLYLTGRPAAPGHRHAGWVAGRVHRAAVGAGRGGGGLHSGQPG